VGAENIKLDADIIPIVNSYGFILNSDLSPTHSSDDWKVCMIQQGIPAIYPETSGKFLPHELNLHTLNAISFDKGCYTVQEIIARMHYRGKIKNHLYYATGSGDLPKAPGADIYALQENEWKESGMIVDAVRGDDQHHLLIVADNRNTLYLTKDIRTI